MNLQSTKTLCTAVFVTFGLLFSQAASPGNGKANKLIKTAGPVYSQLVEDWWQYYIRLPDGISPDNVPDGPIDCMFSQKGNVWFIPSPAGFPREYQCTIKQKALFFPILTQILFNAEVFGAPMTLEEKLAFLDEAEQVFCGRAELDGVQTSRTYPTVFIQSPMFTYESGDDLFARVFGWAPGEIRDTETVAAGFHVLLPALSPGNHTLRIFGGIGCDGTGVPAFTVVDNFYSLTVTGDDDDDSDDDESDDDD